VNPVSDKEIIDAELQLKDLESVDKKIQRIDKAARVGDAKAKAELEVLSCSKPRWKRGRAPEPSTYRTKNVKPPLATFPY
jgi:ribosome-binding ATPase YchF (GTP1/OBG family)